MENRVSSAEGHAASHELCLQELPDKIAEAIDKKEHRSLPPLALQEKEGSPGDQHRSGPEHRKGVQEPDPQA